MLASSAEVSPQLVARVDRLTVLLCQVGSLACALPLNYVLETMRPLPLQPIAWTADFIAGVSLIRGRPVPVVDLACLLGSDAGERRTRLVLVQIGERSAALLVGGVIGVRSLEASALGEMPALLRGQSAEVITAVGSLDARLLLLLETSRMIPERSWANLERGGALRD